MAAITLYYILFYIFLSSIFLPLLLSQCISYNMFFSSLVFFLLYICVYKYYCLFLSIYYYYCNKSPTVKKESIVQSRVNCCSICTTRLFILVIPVTTWMSRLTIQFVASIKTIVLSVTHVINRNTFLIETHKFVFDADLFIF